jgi:hypothetical protein
MEVKIKGLGETSLYNWLIRAVCLTITMKMKRKGLGETSIYNWLIRAVYLIITMNHLIQLFVARFQLR